MTHEVNIQMPAKKNISYGGHEPMKNKVVVVALGGNAIIRAKQKGTIDEQKENIRNTAKQIVQLIKQDYKLVITHGNGPQVGNVLLQQEAGIKFGVPVLPLDVCGAETQGWIGYLLQQALLNEAKKNGINLSVGTIITQVLVDINDPAFLNPTKFIGRFYTEEEAKILQKERGFPIKKDSDRGWRRVVPSPKPKGIIEKNLIKTLVKENHLVIASGGGGVPVFLNEENLLEGCEAVIDKDLAAAILGKEVGADILLILTDTDYVYLHYEDKAKRKKITTMTVTDAKKYLKEGHFPPGSMGPKIEAAINFLENGGNVVYITKPEFALSALKEEKGTKIVKG